MGTEQEIWTVRDVIAWTATRLARADADSPRLEAELLLSHVLKISRVDLYIQFDRPLDKVELAQFKDMVRRRIQGEPIAYIIGSREFWKHRFKVDNRVMIPRPDTELVVEQGIEFLKARPRGSYVDVCTGSGNIPISILLDLPDHQGTGLDVSDDALVVADENRLALGLGDRLTLRQGFLLEPVLDQGRVFDLVTANPPYIPDPELPGLARQIRDFEPRISLTSGDDGLDLIRVLLPQVAGVLVPGGLFLMEFGGLPQSGEIIRLAGEAGLKDVKILQDLSETDRVLSARG